MSKQDFGSMSEDELCSAIDLALGDYSRLVLEVGSDMSDAASESDLREAVHRLSDTLHSLRVETVVAMRTDAMSTPELHNCGFIA